MINYNISHYQHFFMKQEQKDYQHRSFFLFVNSSSGANVGTQLLNQQVQRIQFILPPGDYSEKEERLNLFIYNLRSNRQAGFKRLKSQLQSQAKCYAIVCGGDGSVMWVVTQLVKHQINVSSVPIGIIPLGTGNDFSRQLGWGYEKSNLLNTEFKNIKKELRSWIKAKEQYFDIWDVQAEIYEDGKFEKVHEGVNQILPGLTYSRTFCNYFSFGIDGKIGYSFDMHRTKSRLGNLAMYGCIGLVKTFTRTKNLDELLDYIEIQRTDSSIKQNRSTFNSKSIKETNSASFLSRNSIVAKSSIFQSKQKEKEKETVFQKDHYNILVLNINSYTGGVKDIWNNAQKRFIKNVNLSDEESQISTADGKLEVVSFGSSMGIALERISGGHSKKVAQGSGPFVFQFHKYQNRQKHRTYLQIDGEFIRFTNPKRITIRHSELTPKGKIKVLRNSQSS